MIIRHLKNISFLLSILLICPDNYGQGESNIAEKLGYPANAKLLIIHADDLGLAHSVNAASIAALESRAVSSASIMVPCPWFNEIADYAKNNPDLDFGVHITLSGEWKIYRWDGVLPSNEIPNLLDEKDYFFHNSSAAVKSDAIDEVKSEIHAQIQRALDFGINITHIDTHVGTMFKSDDLLQAYFDLGREYHLPVLISRNQINLLPDSLIREYADDIVFVDHRVSVGLNLDANWDEAYRKSIENMQPGLNFMIVHLGYDDPELQAVCIDHPAYGSGWREKDFKAVTNKAFINALKENNIILVSWKEVWDAYNSIH